MSKNSSPMLCWHRHWHQHDETISWEQENMYNLERDSTFLECERGQIQKHLIIREVKKVTILPHFHNISWTHFIPKIGPVTNNKKDLHFTTILPSESSSMNPSLCTINVNWSRPKLCRTMMTQKKIAWVENRNEQLLGLRGFEPKHYIMDHFVTLRVIM